MKLRHLILMAASSLTLTACGMMPGSNDAASTEPPAEPAEISAEAVSTAGLTVGTDDPESLSRQIGRYTTYARTDCNSDRARRAAFMETLEKLKANALDDGADYLRVLGTGGLETRGLCHNDMFQLTGVAFREEVFPQGMMMGNGGAQMTTDSLTSRLEELDALRERGLLTDGEYQQLRDRVLNEAY